MFAQQSIFEMKKKWVSTAWGADVKDWQSEDGQIEMCSNGYYYFKQPQS